MWLQERFGNEFSFLQQNGLSIYKERDREKGKDLLRALMQRDREASVTYKGRKLGCKSTLPARVTNSDSR